MTTNFNNINGIGVGLNTNLPKKEATTDVKENVVQDAPQANSAANLMSQDEVLNVMAQQAALNKSAINIPKTYDVSRYVTPEQAQRIAGFVTSFEDIVAQNLQTVTAEFGNSLSEGEKMNIALSSADKLVS